MAERYVRVNKVKFEGPTALNERPCVLTKEPHAPYRYDKIRRTKAFVAQSASASLVHGERGECEVERERTARIHGPSMVTGTVPISVVVDNADIRRESSRVEERLSGS